MGVATAISLGLTAAGGIKQAIDASNQKAAADNAAQQEANKLARINEADRFQALQVPTLGLELAQQNIQSEQANALRALQESGGAAGVLGGLTALNQQGRAQDLQLAAQANQMEYQRNMAQAQNAQQIEQNRVAREAGLAQSRLQGAQVMGAQARNAEQAAYAGLAENALNAAFMSQYFKKPGGGGANVDIPAGTPQVNPNATGVAPGVAQQSFTQPVGTTALNNQNNVSGWQNGVFNAQIASMPTQNTAQPMANYPGLYNVNTGDPLNDMYNRNAALGDLWMYTNPRF